MNQIVATESLLLNHRILSADSMGLYFDGARIDAFSGFSGYQGASGYSGYSGYSGSGQSGYSGYSGYRGVMGGISQAYIFDASTVDSNPASGKLRFNATDDQLFISNINVFGVDISAWLDYNLYSDSTLNFEIIHIFNINDPTVFVEWVQWNPIVDGGGYRKVPVGLGFSNNVFNDGDQIVLTITPWSFGNTGNDGSSGYSGFSGQGLSGFSGYSGDPAQQSGYSGYSGSGLSGYSGYSGQSGVGISGYSGYCGTSGYSGFCGYSGYSGFCGQSGYSGYSGGVAFSGAPHSVNYTTVIGDANGVLVHPGTDSTARTFTIASNASVAYPLYTTLTFINESGAGNLNIAINSDTLYLAGLVGTTGTRTLVAVGIATAIKVETTTWIISGVNLT